jgi:hypothetical protein
MPPFEGINLWWRRASSRRRTASGERRNDQHWQCDQYRAGGEQVVHSGQVPIVKRTQARLADGREIIYFRRDVPRRSGTARSRDATSTAIERCTRGRRAASRTRQSPWSENMTLHQQVNVDRLDGGNTGGAVRLGDTVRRVAGPWTPAVHALLEHLAANGFTRAPRPPDSSTGTSPARSRGSGIWRTPHSVGYRCTPGTSLPSKASTTSLHVHSACAGSWTSTAGPVTSRHSSR